VVAGAALAAEEPKPAGEPKAEAPAIQPDWRKDLDSALKEAAASDRVVLIYFYADWCQPCEWMDRGCFGNKPMVTFISRHFIPLRVDDSKETSLVSRKFGIRVYPSVLFLLPSGETLHLAIGPHTPDAFANLLNQIRLFPELVRDQKKAPDDLEANFALGNAFAMLNQLHRAAPYLERAAELDPENKHGRRSQAKLILATVPLEDGNAAATLDNLGMYLLDFSDAPEVPTAMYYVGTVFYGEKRYGEAREAFAELQKRFPRHPITYKADKAIEHIDGLLRAVEQGEPEVPKPEPKAKPPEPATDTNPAPKG
jgi:tetratricopeptide (TPR) repeat protein